jgi:hypothetical protein
MGIILFWIYDDSTNQVRTRALLDKSVAFLVKLQVSSIPLLAPLRRRAVELIDATGWREDSHDGKRQAPEPAARAQ